MSSQPRSSGDVGITSGGTTEYSNPEVGVPSQDTESSEGMAAQAQERAHQAGEKAMQGAEAGRERAAEGMHKGAEQLRSRFSEGEGVQAQVGTRVADTMDRASGYLRDHETKEVWDDMERMIREHPMSAAATALVTGFVIARILR
jgi:ElaB/YqjD/DUF883 family membrane-anchored ribosome-binding protein